MPPPEWYPADNQTFASPCGVCFAAGNLLECQPAYPSQEVKRNEALPMDNKALHADNEACAGVGCAL